MPKSITIRNVPDEVRDELAARAASSGRSLQEFLHAELTRLAQTPDQAALIARMRARVKASGSRVSAETIVAAIHEGRR
jgi:antitoxin FitA